MIGHRYRTAQIADALTNWHAAQTRPKLLILAPPQSGKTQAVTGHIRDSHHGHRVAYATYGHAAAKLAIRRADLPPNILAWVGGVRDAITGAGLDRLLVDDPIKNQEQANSAAERDRLWRWWHEVPMTCMRPDGRAALIMHRWHKDDLAGRLLATKPSQWTVVDLRGPHLSSTNGRRSRPPNTPT